jgi:hypothetical protein
MYQRNRKHKGPMAECKTCMARMSAQDAAYTARVSREALRQAQIANRISRRRIERAQQQSCGIEKFI